MNLLIRPVVTEPGMDADVVDTGWADEPLDYVRFRLKRMATGQTLAASADGHELCLVLLSGRATVRAGDAVFKNIGQRMDVFEQVPPYSVYVPNDTAYSITALTEAEIGICSAPGHGNHAPRLIAPDQVKCSTRGSSSNTRHIHDILPETEPADSLLVVEVYTPAGNWSSYPPHKHDTDNLPTEAMLEESYYHRLNPSQGFAFQRIYSDDRTLDESLAVDDGCCVIVPRGYHPVGAPHGFDLYYLNVMAGPKRQWRFSTDPDYAWLLQQV